MGNGKPFDEMAMTIAIPCEDVLSKKIRYNTHATITNLDNGMAADVMITDCGGFSKYNRIADVSLGVYKAIDAKTDVSNIEIKIHHLTM